MEAVVHVKDDVLSVDLVESDLLEDLRHRLCVVEGAERAVVDACSVGDETTAKSVDVLRVTCTPVSVLELSDGFDSGEVVEALREVGRHSSTIGCRKRHEVSPFQSGLELAERVASHLPGLHCRWIGGRHTETNPPWFEAVGHEFRCQGELVPPKDGEQAQVFVYMHSRRPDGDSPTTTQVDENHLAAGLNQLQLQIAVKRTRWWSFGGTPA